MSYLNAPHLHDEAAAYAFVEARIWPQGRVCPHCGVVGQSSLMQGKSTRIGLYKCYACRQPFNVKIGTIFEQSKVPLHLWLQAIFLIASSKKGVSANQLHRTLGVTLKTAWFMGHRIRVAMKVGGFTKVDGVAEVDETYVGGKRKNMHKSKRDKVGVGGAGKAIVAGVLKRGDEKSASRVRAMLIADTTVPTIDGMVRANVEPGSAVMTDAHSGYRLLSDAYKHEFVNHTTEYVRGQVHTNGIENFWSLLKRSLRGTYVSVDPAHLLAYVDEQAFRFNERKSNDGERFRAVAGSVAGKRLTYKELIGHDQAKLPA